MRGAVFGALLVLLPFLGSCPSSAPPPTVVLITVDTLRADHLGSYGVRDVSTPALDGIAAKGARAAAAWAPFGRTTQSVGSILTGLHPLHHGADGLGMKLPEEVLTLPEVLSAAGYRTAAFVSNVHLKRSWGFDQGCDVYSNPPARWASDSAPQITAEALAWAKEHREGSRPLFLWVHYLDPHWPYSPPERVAAAADPEWNEEFDLFEEVASGRLTKGRVIFDADQILSQAQIDHARRLYRAEVGYTDQAIATLLAGLEEAGVLEDGIVAMTADHGEAMGDHRYWFAHGEYLYDDTLRVPFLVQAPGRVPPGTVIEGNVKLEDMAPTVLDLAGLDPPDGLDGVSLAPLMRRGGVQTVSRRLLVHLTDHNLVHPENPRRPVAGREGRWWALRDGDWKLIRIPLGEGNVAEELYDLAADPGETRNRLADQPARADRLRKELAEAARELLSTSPRHSPDTGNEGQQLDALRSLGYID